MCAPISRGEVHVRARLCSNVTSRDFLFFFVSHDGSELFCRWGRSSGAHAWLRVSALARPGRTQTPRLCSPPLLIWILEDEQQEISIWKLRGKERNEKESAETHGAQ